MAWIFRRFIVVTKIKITLFFHIIFKILFFEFSYISHPNTSLLGFSPPFFVEYSVWQTIIETFVKISVE